MDPHPYDNTLKAWFGEDAKLIIPEFLPEARLLGENHEDLNIEIDRTKLKADLVYTILYEGERQLLNMELQNMVEQDGGIVCLLPQRRCSPVRFPRRI